MLKKNIWVITCFLLAACGGPAEDPSITVPTEDKPKIHGDLATGIGMSADDLKVHSESMVRNLIETFGQQQTFAMLGWQQGPDYKPMQHCFNHWHGTGELALTVKQVDDCELHVKDLSRLYASYGADAKPVLFKSYYYWEQLKKYHSVWPGLVEAWKAAGGKKGDASYLKHPVCAEPLQKGWTGSDFFYDGQESPICSTYKIEAIEALENSRD